MHFLPRTLGLISLQSIQFTGDGAFRDKDGYYWIRGRVDDVVNVSGHRLSTSEIEAALIEHCEPYLLLKMNRSTEPEQPTWPKPPSSESRTT